MGKRFLMSVLVLFCALSLTTLAEARGGHGSDGGVGGYHRPSPGMMGGAMPDITQVKELKLTKEQKLSIEKLRDARQKDVYALEDSLTAKGRELREVLAKAIPDEELVFAMERDMGEIRHKLFQKNLEYRQGVAKILTAEQRETLKGFGPRGECMGRGSCMADKGDSPRGRRSCQ